MPWNHAEDLKRLPPSERELLDKRREEISQPLLSSSAAGSEEDGRDPIEARREALAERVAGEARQVKFRDAAAMYIDAHEPGWRNAKHGLDCGALLVSSFDVQIGVQPQIR
ncbi:hypothetical protein [Ottowia caeni]|uniref:hypothetical protein n=1 Tax=Ottowia caeni TaxID=2870339 RepID=UPI003D72AF8F